jgi:glucosamine--fructose-6-phosphate aminotransferase (isomerizing)
MNQSEKLETTMGATEQTIFEQFSYWTAALKPVAPRHEGELNVYVGCGTSYNLALSLAALANEAARPAIAVPGGEWLNRPQVHWPQWQKTHVIGLSRSGETTEMIAVAKASRAVGAFVTAITVEPDSSFAKNCDRLLVAETHPMEGIVMTTSASLMLLLGIADLGHDVPASLIDIARRILEDTDARMAPLLDDRSHIVYLGAGHLYGVALEGALKLMEMSQVFTQTFHPLEYRHGPISLVDERTAAVMLHSQGEPAAEADLVGELQEKGARVLGFGGPGDVSLPVDCVPALAGLAVLPALQLLGERAAQAHNLDTSAPRHLTKVVTLT